MNLLTRYLDSELSESEAETFLDQIEADADLRHELRCFEQLAALSQTLEKPPIAPDFTTRVMREIAWDDAQLRSAPHASTAAHQAPLLRGHRVWLGSLLSAAALVLAFVGGVFVAQQRTDPPSRASGAEEYTTLTTSVPTARHTVRLVYVPTSPDVQQVHVAGTFNAWDPQSLPLRRRDGAWTTTLTLPAGSYEYMFVENGEYWRTDPFAPMTRDDGFGGTNAILDLGV